VNLEKVSQNYTPLRLMKPTPSTMPSAAIKKQYSSVLPLFCHGLLVFDKIYGMQSVLYFYRLSNTN